MTDEPFVFRYQWYHKLLLLITVFIAASIGLVNDDDPNWNIALGYAASAAIAWFALWLGGRWENFVNRRADRKAR